MSHVGYVLPGIDKVGGAERQALVLAVGLARRGWRVSFVVLSGEGGEAAADLKAAGVEFVTLRMRRGVVDPRGWVRFHRWVRTEAPDVLHTHLPHAAWMARGSRVLAPVRMLVHTVHTSRMPSRLQRGLYRISGVCSDGVTAVSEAVAETCVSAGVAKRDRLLVLPNGIDVVDWTPDTAARSRVRGELSVRGEFLWCAVGRLEPVKDYPTLLRAMAGLPDSARLVIAGGGPLEVSLRGLAAELGVAERVRFLGFQKDVRPWIQAADALVLSSLWEGMPLNVLEAGGCGVPCVATGVAGTREIVADGETGFLAEAGSVEALQRAMLRMMETSREARSAMGMSARRRIVERFSLDAVLDSWEMLYRRLLEQNPAPRRLAGRSDVVNGLGGDAGSGAVADVRLR